MIKNSRSDNSPRKPNEDVGHASVNISELVLRLDNDRELFRELLDIFKREFPAHCSALRDAVNSQELTKVVALSHALKGMLSNLAVTRAASCVSSLEKLARAGNKRALPQAFTSFEQAVEGLVPRLEILVEEAPFENINRR